MADIHPKVTASVAGGGVGGALSLIAVWALNRYTHADIPDVIAQNIGIVITAALAFWAGYQTDSPEGGQPAGNENPAGPQS